MPVPKSRAPACPLGGAQGSIQIGEKAFGTREAVCALGNCHWAFSIFSKRQARNAEIGCFLLNAAGVSNYNRGIADQVHELNVSEWIKKPNTVELGQSFGQRKFLQSLSCAGMHGKCQRHALRRAAQ